MISMNEAFARERMREAHQQRRTLADGPPGLLGAPLAPPRKDGAHGARSLRARRRVRGVGCRRHRALNGPSCAGGQRQPPAQDAAVAGLPRVAALRMEDGCRLRDVRAHRRREGRRRPTARLVRRSRGGRGRAIHQVDLCCLHAPLCEVHRGQARRGMVGVTATQCQPSAGRRVALEPGLRSADRLREARLPPLSQRPEGSGRAELAQHGK